MKQPYFITAIGTPLTEDDQLHEAGLEAHLADQWSHGIDGLLVAGSMGCMQLLTNETYQRLIQRSVDLSRGKGEVLIGAGDASFARTKERIEYINRFKVDGVAVLAPFFFTFGQQDLIEYYRALADVSKAPLYLYDLPQVTKTKLEVPTMAEVAKHPNIRGAKCSDAIAWTRQMMDMVDPKFRVIVAQPEVMDMLIAGGIREHLDGIFAISPQWTIDIGRYAMAGDMAKAAQPQKDMNEVRRAMIQSGVMPSMTAIMNARGIPGRFGPRPFRDLPPAKRDELLAIPVVQKLIQTDSVCAGASCAR